ncbi:MAG: aminoglycoside phosphotransferase family protein [Henriciella sp.]
MDVSIATARLLVDDQFPEYAHLPIESVQSGGTDNTIFRLGEALSLRFPKRASGSSQAEKEHKWLPLLNPLPLAISQPLKRGHSAAEYPHAWSIYNWIPGAPLSTSKIDDWSRAALDLARFVSALQLKTVKGAPRSGAQNNFRGVLLAERDDLTRRAIERLTDEYSALKLLEVWENALAAPICAGEPVWLHGDLQGGNILVREGHLAAIIDFGLSGVGDPACDLMVAWSILPAEVKTIFRNEIACNDGTWARGRGWALSVSTIALEYHRTRTPALSAISRQTISAVLNDF